MDIWDVISNYLSQRYSSIRGVWDSPRTSAYSNDLETSAQTETGRHASSKEAE